MAGSRKGQVSPSSVIQGPRFQITSCLVTWAHSAASTLPVARSLTLETGREGTGARINDPPEARSTRFTLWESQPVPSPLHTPPGPFLERTQTS